MLRAPQAAPILAHQARDVQIVRARAQAARRPQGFAAALLFAAGDRPDTESLRAFAATNRDFEISHEPAPPRRGEADQALRWVELLANGLTFDLTGLAPREGAPLPEARHLFGLPRDLPQRALEAVTLVPGPHLAGGRQMLPVLRSHALLAARLAELPGVVAVAWEGSRSWSAPEFFRGNVVRWIEGGAFPGLGLAALSPTEDGGLVSEGLALFTGQELVLEPRLAEDRAEGARTALRLMHWLVENGAVAQVEDIEVFAGQALQLVPQSRGQVLKVRKLD